MASMATWNRAGDLARLTLSDYWDAAYRSIEGARTGNARGEFCSPHESDVTILPTAIPQGAAD